MTTQPGPTIVSNVAASSATAVSSSRVAGAVWARSVHAEPAQPRVRSACRRRCHPGDFELAVGVAVDEAFRRPGGSCLRA